MANPIPNLPQEILLEIFSLLPTKSVGKYRCLSKTWNNQLSTKQFINSHLTNIKTQQKQQEQKLLFVYQESKSLQILTLPLKNTTSCNNNNNHKWSFVFGSCNGLVLLLDIEHNVFVINPVTRKQIQIPFSADFTGENFLQMYGFGYVPSCDDYKVVILAENYTPDEHGRRYFVDVYSLRTRVWTRVVRAEGPLDDHVIRETNLYDMAFVNGALHWAVEDEDTMLYHIHAFDLATETFREVQYPKEIEHEKLFNTLMVLKGCLSITNDTYLTYHDIWMMKDYGVVDSWVRFRFHVDEMGKRLLPICFVGEEELLSVGVMGRDRWVLCDMKEERVKKIASGRFPFSLGNLDCSVFFESLVSPEQEIAD